MRVKVKDYIFFVLYLKYGGNAESNQVSELRREYFVQDRLTDQYQCIRMFKHAPRMITLAANNPHYQSDITNSFSTNH